MKIKGKTLYAIYKNGEHKGNETGFSEENAIRNYIISSMLSESLDNKEFMQQYSAKVAINGIHHHFIITEDLLN